MRRCLDWDLYVTITRTGTCIVDDKEEVREEPLPECMKKATRYIDENKTVVIDEFQRLPENYWDMIALKRVDLHGVLVLCGSSLGIARKVFNSNSPLLGLVAPFKIDIISPEDTIASLSRILEPREAVLWSVVARDPWILLFLEPRGNPWDEIVRHADRLAVTPSSLIGEVFGEEEKQLTRLYDTVLRLLAHHYWSSKLLAQKLYELKLLSEPHPGIVTGILSQLESMGLVDKIPLWKTRRNRYYYKHRSPILSLILRIEDLVEHELKPRPEDILYDYSIELQFLLGELLARYKELNHAYTILPDNRGDIDIVLLDHKKKPRIAYEVKIGEYTRRDIALARERIEEYSIPRIGLISLTRKPKTTSVDETLGPEDIIEIALKLAEKKREEETIAG